MIVFGIILGAVGFILLIIALRGRVTHRGQFCKNCKFDLAGLKLESADAKCPECGSGIHDESARRSQLRRVSRIGVVISAIVLLVGTSGVIAGATGKTGSIIAAMPDPVVLWLRDLGVDEALDELVVRVSKVPNTLSAKSWDRAIEQGLAFQADKTLAWDRRWGQVLFDALNADKMSREQVEQYFTTGFEFELLVRDRVHPGSSSLANSLNRIQTRMEPLTGGASAHSIRNQITAVRAGESVPFFEQDLHEWKRPLHIYNDGFQSSSSAGTDGYQEIFDKSPGEQVKFVFSYTMRLDRGDNLFFEKIARERVTVNVIDPSEPIVRIVQNDAIAQSVFDSTFITGFKITEVFHEPPKNNGMPPPNATAIMAAHISE